MPKMSTVKGNLKKRVLAETEDSIPEKRKGVILEEDFDIDLSSDLKEIVSVLQQIREKAQKDGQKKNDETISSDLKEIVSALQQIREKAQKDGQKKNDETKLFLDIKSMVDELKSKLEKERQSLAKALSKSSKECENLLKNETAKFQSAYEKFCKEKVAHLQALKDTISKYEEEKERLFMRYEQQRKKEKNMILEHEKACSNKIAELEESLKKKKQDDKTFSILRKTLGSFLDNASDEDFPPDY